jgi:hypothetical protein
MDGWLHHETRSRYRSERRVGARLFGALRTVGNPDHGGADSGEAVFYASPALGVNFRI